MILKQYYLGCLSHASYLIADEVTSKAVIVDPQRDIDQYLEDAAGSGLKKFEQEWLEYILALNPADGVRLAGRHQ